MGFRTAQLLDAVGRLLVYRAPHEARCCPSCESAAIVPLGVHKLPRPLEGRRTGFISGCEGCGLVFVNPVPSEEALAAFYSHEGEWGAGRQEADARDDSPPGTKRTGAWVRLFDPIRGELAVTDPPPGSRVLDFGCGTGKFLDVLQSCGWETYGIDPALDHAFTKHRRLMEIPSAPEFRLVILHHVLEHVTAPRTLLRQLAAATLPGGYIFVAVPRLDTLPVHRDYGYLINRAHVTAYTWPCLELLLLQSGWTAVAPPADEVAISGGRRTTARLRVLARRTAAVVAANGSPLNAARASLRAYYDTAVPMRSALERRGVVRLSARIAESRRQVRKWLK